MTAGMATLYGVGLIVAGAFVLCAFLAFYYTSRDWLRRLLRKLRQHRPDCACDERCWPRHVAWMDKLHGVHVADQIDAMVEEQQQGRQW